MCAKATLKLVPQQLSEFPVPRESHASSQLFLGQLAPIQVYAPVTVRSDGAAF
jgi:hypothetical protein